MSCSVLMPKYVITALLTNFIQCKKLVSRADYGKVQFSEWAPVTNGHLQRKRYQNTVRVK